MQLTQGAVWRREKGRSFPEVFIDLLAGGRDQKIIEGGV